MNNESTIREAFAHLDDDRESASRYLPIFIDESEQTLDELTEALLALESGGGRESIEQLFIAAHRIKGSAASIGLNRVAKLAHLMEDLLQVLVDQDRTLAPELADGMLACTDGLRQYVDALKGGRLEDDRFADLAQQLWEAQSACDFGGAGAAESPGICGGGSSPHCAIRTTRTFWSARSSLNRIFRWSV
jgi:two-component system chemotaxis sensor kinase CheA